MQRSHAALFLFAAVVIGAALRTFHPTFCPTADEFITLRYASKVVSWDLIPWLIGRDYNPPGYYVFAIFTAHLTKSAGIEILRIPALVFGILAIPSMYFLGKKINGVTLGTLTAVTSSMLFPYIYYSQNARAYTLVMLCFIWFAWCFVDVYCTPTRTGYIMLVCSAILCLCSHFYSVIPISVALILLVAKYRSATLVASICAGCIVLLSVFWKYLLILLNHLSVYNLIQHDIFWIGPADIAIMLPNELLGWAWILFIPLMILSLRNYNLDVSRPVVLIAAITCISCIPMTIFTAMLPRYALLVSPLLVCVALIPLAEHIEAMDTKIKQVAAILAFAFVVFVFNYGSIIAWNALNTCNYI